MILLPLLLTAAQGTITPIQIDACSKDLIRPVASDEVHYRFGGEIREIESIFENGTTYIWTAEDGGRIRHSSDSGQTWRFQETPADARQTLLDIEFTDTQNGFACGRGGILLHTTNGGATWDHYSHSQPRILDQFGSIATNWAVRWVDPQLGFVAGVWSLARKGPGSDTFEQVKLWDSEAEVDTQASLGTHLPRRFEFYDVKIVRDSTDPQRWIGVATGDRNSGLPSEPPGAFVFYTDSASPKSQGGQNWWKVLETDGAPGNGVLRNPWEIEFEAEEAAPSGSGAGLQANGYLVGGNTVGRGFFYSTTDGGQTWTEEFATTTPNDPPLHPGLPSELYAVAAMPGGKALAVGYAGHAWYRNPTTSSTARWEWRPLETTPDGNYTPFERFTGPITCIDPAGGSRAILGGSFGLLRGTVDAGQSYLYLNPTHDAASPEAHWRIEDVHFFGPNEGIGVGQFQLIARTTDGGSTWTRIQGGPCNPLSGCNSTAHVSVAFQTRLRGVVALARDVNGALPLLQWTADGGATWNPSTVPQLQSAKLVEVVSAGSATYWAIGSNKEQGVTRPLVLLSRNHGRTWMKVAAPSTSNQVQLTGAAFLSAGQGFLIGNDADIPVAWKLDVSGGAISWQDISPPLPSQVEVPLRDIAAQGATYATAQVYAVGAYGSAYKFDPSSGPHGQLVVFAPVQTLQVPPFGSPFEVNLSSVAISPSGNRVLFGTEAWVGPLPSLPMDEADEREKLTLDANQLGFLLRWDESAQWLDLVKSGSNDGTARLQLMSDTCGVMLARSATGLDSGEIGTVADFTVLVYDED